MVNNTTPLTESNIGEQFLEESIPVGLPWRVLVFSIILFCFSLLIYAGLRFGYTSYLDNRERTLDQNIEQLGNQVTREDQDRLVSFYSQLTNLKKVLDRHVFAANIFPFLEKNTLGSMYWNTAGYADDTKTLSLKGHAPTLETVVEQLALFDKRPELKKVSIESITFDKEGVAVVANLAFSDSYFNQPTQ